MAVGAVLCCAVLLLPFVLLVYASTEVTKNVVLLPECAPESYQQIKKYILGQEVPKCLFWEKPYITLVVTSKIGPITLFYCQNVLQNLTNK